ncbi:MAG: HAMP domain-containing protein [Okeania sp. SIO2F4]|uniref:ATP-binding protein n=1 Tax=Okeania sp. SIO2F4 TaxID=2607790 RepID=UPI00142A50AF|nr:ATP-binding protein [Okeania sp. SIO2F4]NES07424.1 HAMP domain-containing protein [Okeania sp. SIO2F4]
MKLIAKFLSSSTLCFSIITFLLLGSEVFINKAEISVAKSREKTLNSIEKVICLQVALAHQIEALKDYLFLAQNTIDMRRYQRAKLEFTTCLQELDSLMPDVEEISVIQRRHQNIIRLANSLESTFYSVPETQQDIRALNSFSKDIQLYLKSLAKTTEYRDDITRKKAQQLKQISRLAKYVIIVSIFLVFLVQFKLIFLPVINSIKQLKEGTNKIGKGELNHRLNLKTNDEIGELAAGFNQMTIQLAESRQKLGDKLQELTLVNHNLNTEIENRNRAEAELQKSLGLIQSEKMSSLSQMVAGIAHEINNPVNFIHGNLTHAETYSQELLNLINLYQQHYPNPVPEIEDELEAIELDFLVEDFSKLLTSMRMGTERIIEIVTSLRTFSRLDEADIKKVDIHQGLDGTLLILQHRLKTQNNRPEIRVIKDYGKLPLISCYSGQLNQVFLNILTNAIDALEEQNRTRTLEEIHAYPSQIRIQTFTNTDKTLATIKIADNGCGIPSNVLEKLFNPFFTTKPVGKGTGLGLAIAYQIIKDRHHGKINCYSEPGKGAEFVIEIPVQQTH